jgi:uncharacterized protein YjbI with pentapeptide repeats
MNQQLLSQLRMFVDNHRTARDLVLIGADLRKSQLSDLRADSLNFEEVDLRESFLIEVKWKGCNLREARLDGADFTDAVLRMCDLDEGRLTNATFVRTRLENSTARGARFDGVDLTGAVLTDTNFSRASFRGANLEGVSALGADFRGADFRAAQLRNAIFVDADLRGADFTDADLQGADLRGADMRGVVGNDPALQKDDSRWGGLPTEMKALTETMTPIVLEVLKTGGRRGLIDPATAQQLIEEATQQPGLSTRNAPSLDTLEAVSRVLDELGDDVLPGLMGALQQPNEGEPPPEAKAIILRLREEFGLSETASVEDVLAQLMQGLGRR